jgi:acetylornithine deacetylase
MAKPETLQILADLVGFDTTSRNSNLALIDYVERYLAKHGVSSKRVPDETGLKANLIATIGPADVPGYVLSGHTDVVPVDGQDWSTDPFKLTRKGDRLYGRGTCDMKSFSAVALAFVPEMAKRPLARPIHLALSYDEEVGCLGVRGIVAEMNRWKVKPAACIVGEPSGMEVVIAHKGKRSMRCDVRGLAAHSSLAPLAVNAVEYAARLVTHISDIGRRLAEKGPRDPLYDVAWSTAHVGPIQGGVQLNIVPEDCWFEFEFRTLPEDDAEALVAEVEAWARRELEPAMKAIHPAAGFEFSLRSEFPGLDTPADEGVVAFAKQLAGKNAHRKVAFGTEAGLFSRQAGIPTVVCGPAVIDQAHKPDEFVELAQLERCEAFIARLIEAACRPA